jgi:hypothetical protein
MLRDRQRFLHVGEYGRDRTSNGASGARRTVDPYRDAREALVARRRALGRQLAEIDRRIDEGPGEGAGERRSGERQRATGRWRMASGFFLGFLACQAIALVVFAAVVPRSREVTVVGAAAAPVPELVAKLPLAIAEPRIAAPPPAPIVRTDLDRHIRWIAPEAWEIDRVLVDRALGASAGLSGGPTAILHERNGQPIGVRIYGIRRDSILGRLGFENGDTLLDVNGYEVTGADGALAAYERLRDAPAFFIRLERQGETRLHMIRVAAAD